MKWRGFTKALIVLCVTSIFTVSCATMGPGPVKLSMELGDRISEMQGIHQRTLKRFFESERARIDTFLKEKWVPHYFKIFINDSEIINAFERDLKQGVEVTPRLIEWSIDAQRVIERRRKEMLQPVMESEEKVTAEVAKAYAEMLKANGVITARLEAAVRVKEVQDKLLDGFQVAVSKLLPSHSQVVSETIEDADQSLTSP